MNDGEYAPEEVIGGRPAPLPKGPPYPCAKCGEAKMHAYGHVYACDCEKPKKPETTPW